MAGVLETILEIIMWFILIIIVGIVQSCRCTELSGTWYFSDCYDWQTISGFCDEPDLDACMSGHEMQLSFTCERSFRLLDTYGEYEITDYDEPAWKYNGHCTEYSGQFEVNKDTVPAQLDLIIKRVEYHHVRVLWSGCGGDADDQSHSEDNEELEARAGATWLTAYALENGDLTFVNEYNTDAEGRPDEDELARQGTVMTHERPRIVVLSIDDVEEYNKQASSTPTRNAIRFPVLQAHP